MIKLDWDFLSITLIKQFPDLMQVLNFKYILTSIMLNSVIIKASLKQNIRNGFRVYPSYNTCLKISLTTNHMSCVLGPLKVVLMHAHPDIVDILQFYSRVECLPRTQAQGPKSYQNIWQEFISLIFRKTYFGRPEATP